MRTRNLFIIILLLVTACQPAKKSGDANRSTVTPNFLLLSDIHLDTTQTTQYGDDTGLQLWNNFLQKLETVITGPNPPGFVIYTGDLPAHYSCDGDCELQPGTPKTQAHDHNLTVILAGLRQLMEKHHLPFFYLPGNNDAIAGNYFSFANPQQQTVFGLVPSATNPYPALNINTDTSTAPCVISLAHVNKGYYAARPLQRLRLLCMNTVIYSPKYRPVDGGNKAADRNAEMQWLQSELAAATAGNEKVYIAMHIPPGTDAYSNKPMWEETPDQYLQQFLRLVTAYRQNIAGIFFGHTHMDELRRLYDTNGNISAVAISCPGITPQHMNNPGFKTVYYNSQSMAPQDFITYYTTPAASTWGDSTYSFRHVFGHRGYNSIYQQLSNMPLTDISKHMQGIYSVRYLPVKYDIGLGIEVR